MPQNPSIGANANANATPPTPPIRLRPRDIEAFLITHNDVDLKPIKSSLSSMKRIFVTDNERGANMGPLAQFLSAAWYCESEYVYFQDDDCVTNCEAIVAQYEPGTILCNMGTAGHDRNYANKTDKLMGFGSILPRALIRPTFEIFWRQFPIDRVSWREPGRIFTAYNREIVKTVLIPVLNLPWAESPGRLYRRSDHVEIANIARKRVELVRAAQGKPAILP